MNCNEEVMRTAYNERNVYKMELCVYFVNKNTLLHILQYTRLGKTKRNNRQTFVDIK